MLNNYMWQIYLRAGGDEVVEMFRRNLTKEYTPEYAEEIRKLHSVYCPSESISEDIYLQLREVLEFNVHNVSHIRKRRYGIKDRFQRYYGEYYDTTQKPKENFEEFIYNLACHTTLLHVKFPNTFIPYYFKFNFNVLQLIADEFEIELPEIPLKKEYKGRFLYYGEICKALTKFRRENRLSPYELCAFLYDFAPNYIGGIDSYIVKDLPEPKGAYFIGGAKNDIFLSDDVNTLTPWQCSPETRAGDMIVMYLRTPISAIESIWRSVSVGFNDPFFYYYRCTYIGKPVAIDKITQKQLQHDPILGEMPIVRKNMQGINGVELKPSEYNHLMELAKAKVFRLEYAMEEGDTEFFREKDVEDKLIKPLLLKLGYSENDYSQQLYVRVGNRNRLLIPDFVILPEIKGGHHSAFAIIEAKLKINNEKEFEVVKIQARSYAKQLSIKYSIIISKDKIWISTDEDDFDKDIFVATWGECSNADTFSKLYKLIGKRA